MTAPSRRERCGGHGPPRTLPKGGPPFLFARRPGGRGGRPSIRDSPSRGLPGPAPAAARALRPGGGHPPGPSSHGLPGRQRRVLRADQQTRRKSPPPVRDPPVRPPRPPPRAVPPRRVSPAAMAAGRKYSPRGAPPGGPAGPTRAIRVGRRLPAPGRRPRRPRRLFSAAAVTVRLGRSRKAALHFFSFRAEAGGRPRPQGPGPGAGTVTQARPARCWTPTRSSIGTGAASEHPSLPSR